MARYVDADALRFEFCQLIGELENFETAESQTAYAMRVLKASAFREVEKRLDDMAEQSGIDPDSIRREAASKALRGYAESMEDGPRIGRASEVSDMRDVATRIERGEVGI